MAAIDETKYRDIATPEDIDWLLSHIDDKKNLSVFNNMGPAVALPDLVAQIHGDESDRKRLRDRLAETDGQRLVYIRLFAKRAREKIFPVNCLKGFSNERRP